MSNDFDFRKEADKNIDKGASWVSRMWGATWFRYTVAVVLAILVLKFLFF